MAASDVLQFNCSIENEIAQSATKDFAKMLGKAFEQYKKLWNEYLKLRKYCEDVDVKIPFQLCESENYQNKNVNLPSKTSTHYTEPLNKLPEQESSASLYESISNNTCSNNTCAFDDNILSDSKSLQKQIRENELLKSPILAKRYSKSRKINVLNNHSVLEDSNENSVSIPMKENIPILANNSKRNVSEVFMESKEDESSFIENNNEQIECTPTPNIPKKLSISKLYNVDTTLLQNGKKFKQSKLVFLSRKENIDNTVHKVHRMSPLKPHMSVICERNMKENSKNRLKSTDEEIIEDSPNKRTESNLKIKSLKLKKKSPFKRSEKSCIFDKVVNSKINGTKLSSMKINQSSHSQYLSHVQENEPYIIKRSKTFASSGNENTVSNCATSSSSPELIKAEDLYLHNKYNEFDNNLSIPMKEIKHREIVEYDNQAQKRKFSKSTSQSFTSDSSTYNDETFFILGEKPEKNPTYNMSGLKEEAHMSDISPSPPAKKSLMNSFDILPEKKNDFTYKSSKSRAERAKMTGVSCWECKQYYANLGLSEEEIKARQNQCSRHRVKYSERQSTPEGFWDPLFPDSFSSTFQD